jgi:hypothetical protein
MRAVIYCRVSTVEQAQMKHILGDPVMIVYLDKDGRMLPSPSGAAHELRNPGAGWRWTDVDGAERTTAGAPIGNEFYPRCFRSRNYH